MLTATPPRLPKVMSHAEWIRGTSVRMKPRGAEMKKLDEAILLYEKTPISRMHAQLQQAFEDWKRSKGPGEAWKKSERNAGGTLTLLNAQLAGEADTDRLTGTPDFMAADMINARLGVLYLFGNMHCDDSMFSIALEGAIDLTSASIGYVSDTRLEKDEADKLGNRLATANEAIDKLRGDGAAIANAVHDRIKARLDAGSRNVAGATLLGGRPQPPTKPALLRAWNWLREKLADVAKELMAAIRAKMEEFGDAARNRYSMESVASRVRQLCDFLADRFLKDAAPLISAGLDIAKGVTAALDAGIAKFREWSASKRVNVMAGHPTAIVEGIRQAMWRSLGSGLYDVLKGGVNLGIQVGTIGAGALVTLITSVVETLVKTIWRMFEVTRMGHFLDEARDHWTSRNQPGGLHEHPLAFNAWFRGHTVASPALACLALGSGICGDKMRFLQMYQSNGAVISQSTFNAGVSYLDALRIEGAKYLRSAGFGFSSEDDLVQGLIDGAIELRPPAHTHAQRAWQFTLGFLNG